MPLAGPGPMPGPPGGWNNTTTMDGWDLRIDAYCNTDTSGSNPIGTSSVDQLQRDTHCGCFPLATPLYTQCIPQGGANINAISVRVRPHAPVGTSVFTTPNKPGFITIGLKYTILEI